jgi:hypothetical protein
MPEHTAGVPGHIEDDPNWSIGPEKEELDATSIVVPTDPDSGTPSPAPINRVLLGIIHVEGI